MLLLSVIVAIGANYWALYSELLSLYSETVRVPPIKLHLLSHILPINDRFAINHALILDVSEKEID